MQGQWGVVIKTINSLKCCGYIKVNKELASATTQWQNLQTKEFANRMRKSYDFVVIWHADTPIWQLN